MGGVYPAGINIGRVSRILYQEYETSMEVELESFVDFSRLEYVFVLDLEPRPVPEEAEGASLAEWSGTEDRRRGDG
jgi:rod shape-determining protein MreC